MQRHFLTFPCTASYWPPELAGNYQTYFFDWIGFYGYNGPFFRVIPNSIEFILPSWGKAQRKGENRCYRLGLRPDRSSTGRQKWKKHKIRKKKHRRRKKKATGDAVSGPHLHTPERERERERERTNLTARHNWRVLSFSPTTFSRVFLIFRLLIFARFSSTVAHSRADLMYEKSNKRPLKSHQKGVQIRSSPIKCREI